MFAVAGLRLDKGGGFGSVVECRFRGDTKWQAGHRKVMAMYDRNLDYNWHVDIEFDEDETHTHAIVRAQLGDGETMTTLGDAYRNPKDSSQPMIGEEIAAARGLIALGTELLQRASTRIEQVTHHPVHLYR
jgi:hypothetical protein